MLFALFLLSCGGDIGIRTVDKTQPDDTSISIVDTAVSQPSSEPSSSPTSEPSGEPSSEPLEGTVGLVNYTLEQVACQACMGVYQEITINFSAKFHNKINETHPTWFPPAGQCVNSVNPVAIGVSPINIGQSINILGNPNSFMAYNNGTNVYNGFISESQYDRDTMLSVQAQDGTSFQFRSIHGFDFVEPYEMRYVDISYAFAAAISRYGTQFSWGPSGGPDLFNITIATYSPDGSQLLGVVSCSTQDNGFYFFDGSYFQSYPTWALTAIHMTRFSRQRVPYEGLNGYVDAQLEWSVVGTGHIE
jgi:hypothetical protein